jgi:4-amino-4-deoxy-L-arabinose transferase-like glycosyltransferase
LRQDLVLSSRAQVTVVCALFVVAGSVYWALMPFGLGPDEGSHLLFIQTLAREGGPSGPAAGVDWRWGLPVLDTGEGRPAGWDDPNFEVHQPPLYYLLALPFYAVAGVPGVQFLSLVLGVAFLVLTWRCLSEVAAPDLALAATVTVALLPMQTFLASRVNNDALVFPLWAWAFWRWAVVLRDGPTVREGVVSGAALGLALLTKQTALLLVPVSLLVAILAARRTGRWRDATAFWFALLGTAAALAGWWYLRNLVVYGDLFAQRAFDERFLGRRMTPEQLTALMQPGRPEWRYWPMVWDYTVRSYVIYIGHGADVLPHGVKPVQQALLGLGAAGSALALARRWRQRGLDPAVAVAAMLAAALAGLALMYVRFNLTYFQAQARYFLALSPAVALMLTGGLSRPFAPGSLARRYGLLVAPLWFGLLNALVLTTYALADT